VTAARPSERADFRIVELVTPPVDVCSRLFRPPTRARSESLWTSHHAGFVLCRRHLRPGHSSIVRLQQVDP